MMATAWNNGAHHESGAGYGLKISRVDRDRFFEKEWQEVAVTLPGHETPVVVTLTPTFWRKCTELRDKEIGRWLRGNGYAPWRKGKPPKFEMEVVGEKRFRVSTKR